MDIYNTLDLPQFNKFYFTIQDVNKCPTMLEQFHIFLTNYYQAEFLGNLDFGEENELAFIDKNTKIILITEQTISDKFFFKENCLCVILWDDNVWGKLTFFNLMLETNYCKTSFSVDSFRNLIELHQGKKLCERKRIGNYFIGRMIPYAHQLNKVPALFKTQANFHEGYLYGHPSGYLRDYVLYDQNYKSNIKQVIRNLSDNKSKDIFNLVVYGKAEEIWRYYFNNLTANPQYLDYINLQKNSIIIDCGIFRGDELPAFLGAGAEKIYCIDPAGNDHLSEYAKVWCEQYSNRIIFIRKWLHAGNVPEEETTTLTKVIQENDMDCVDFIKSDVEGAERDMVPDLIDIMEKYRPQLAISIYHTQILEAGESPVIDVVRIPLQLMHAAKNYNFYLNFYSYERWEIVLYCIPKEQIR